MRPSMQQTAKRVALSFAASLVLVILVAGLLPRGFLVNDDPGLILHLRSGTYVPWMSPVLARLLAAGYGSAPDVPWYGLYLYALIVASGTVLFHTCMELVDRRDGHGSVATRIGALMLAASHIIVAVGVTWTTVSMSALGTAIVAFVAHVQSCHAVGAPVSRIRGLLYGLLLVGGFALRQAVLAAVGAALVPLLVWIGVQLLRARYLPRPTAVVAFVAPFLVVFGLQGRVQLPGEHHEEFNRVRGQLSDAAPFSSLDTRAPELLARAGWTVEEYRDFGNWLLADDTEFSTEKLQRLVDTGGIPKPMRLSDATRVLRNIATDSAASVWLLLTILVSGLALAWLRAVDARRMLGFGLAYLCFLAVVPIAMSAVARFPQRVSLSFFTVAAFGMFVFVAGEVARRPARTEARQPALALLAIALCMFTWARHVIVWTADRPAAPYHATLRAFADRVKARGGIVMSWVGIAELDPLLADPRGYDALPSGWGTFTAPWFAYLERFGLRSGSELLHTMVDNPNAYLVATPYARDMFEEWVRRRLHEPRVRLALVDWAEGMPAAFRSELYRLVTTPLARGSAEWQLLERSYRALTAELPGPPDVSARTFHAVALSAPYEQYVGTFRYPAAALTLSPIDDGIRVNARAVREACPPVTANDSKSYYDEGDVAGIYLPVSGLGAVRFDLRLVNAENIMSVNVYAETRTDRPLRWRWDLDREAHEFGFSGAVTLVPGYSAHRLLLVNNTADAQNVRELHVFIAVKPGSQAGFELRHLELAAP